MKSIMGLLVVPLLAYSALGSSMDDAVNSKLIGTRISPQSSAEAAATMSHTAPLSSAASVAHTSPLGSVASMAPMIIDYGMQMSPYSFDFPMPYLPPVMGGVPLSPLSPLTTYEMGLPAVAMPAYTSPAPLMSRMIANQMAIPVATVSQYSYF